MRRNHEIIFAIVLLGVCASAQASSEGSGAYTIPEPIQRVDSIVNNFRKITVLTSGPDRLDRISREKVEALTWTLSQENDGRISDLTQTFADSDGRPVVSNILLFLDRIERPGMYVDGDRLAFANVLEALYASRAQMPDEIRTRLEKEVQSLRKIKSYHVTDAQRGSSRFQESGANSRTWAAYVAYLNGSYNREQLLKDHDSILPRK